MSPVSPPNRYWPLAAVDEEGSREILGNEGEEDDEKQGKLVVLKDLVARSDLNGKKGIVEGPDDREGIWRVRLASGNIVNVKTKNIEELDPFSVEVEEEEG